jgi:glutathionyl-hydroquinone reductase
MGSDGWPFANVDDFPGADADPLNNASHVKDIYLKVKPNYDGRYVCPRITVHLYSSTEISV